MFLTLVLTLQTISDNPNFQNKIKYLIQKSFWLRLGRLGLNFAKVVRVRGKHQCGATYGSASRSKPTRFLITEI